MHIQVSKKSMTSFHVDLPTHTLLSFLILTLQPLKQFSWAILRFRLFRFKRKKHKIFYCLFLAPGNLFLKDCWNVNHAVLCYAHSRHPDEIWELRKFRDRKDRVKEENPIAISTVTYFQYILIKLQADCMSFSCRSVTFYSQHLEDARKIGEEISALKKSMIGIWWRAY